MVLKPLRNDFLGHSPKKESPANSPDGQIAPSHPTLWSRNVFIEFHAGLVSMCRELTISGLDHLRLPK